jgi:hypothetical protein
MSAVIQRHEIQAGAPRESDAGSLMAIINRAAATENFDVDKLEKLLAVKERWDANEARKAFTAAMAAFKANPPEIIKDKHVAFQTSKGMTEYDHATLGSVCAAIVKGLSEHGISHRWDVAQDQRIKVTCILTHEQGHSEQVSLTASADESGGKNSIQAIGSAVTYLQRYTLFAATGLAAMDQDDDGKGTEPSQFITDKQALDLQAKAEEVGVNRENFLRFLKVSKLAELPASKYKAAIQALNDKAAGVR